VLGLNQKFIKHFNRMTESIEISIQEGWIYIHYANDNIEKTVYALKNDEITIETYIEQFFKENRVSEEIRKDVRNYLRNEKPKGNAHRDEFINFLFKALSLHMVFGLTIALTVFAGYKLGMFLDHRYHQYPVFTVMGFFSGIIIGGLLTYIIGQKYAKPLNRIQSAARIVGSPLRRRMKKYPIIDVTIEDVRKAIRKFSESLPQGVYRTILVQDDNSIDFKQLAHFLSGIPSKKFYMSKETYELFEEQDKLIPYEMDLVQKAVDHYVNEKKAYPMLKYDPHRRVNYYLLQSEHYLKTHPQTQFYISKLDGMISHFKT
jgi:hypothetical protein